MGTFRRSLQTSRRSCTSQMWNPLQAQWGPCAAAFDYLRSDTLVMNGPTTPVKTGTSPDISVSGTCSVPGPFRLEILSNGDRGVATARITGNAEDAVPVWTTFMTDTSVVFFGLTISFGAGTYSTDTYWTWGGSITTWNDFSGNGRNVTQGNPTLRPVYSKTNGLNMLTTRWLQSAAFTNVDGPFTVYAAINTAVVIANRGVISLSNLATVGPPRLFRNQNDFILTTDNNTNAVIEIVLNGKVTCGFIANGLGSAIIKQGALYNGRGTLTSAASVMNQICVGALTGLYPIDGYIYGVYVYQGAHSAATVRRYVQGLNRYYSIT